MQVMINGMAEEVPEGVLVAELIDLFEGNDYNLIVEINHRFVHPRDYRTFEVKAGDKVELILPAFGG